MRKKGKITYVQEDRKGHFRYSYKITNYQAAKILEYIAYGKLAEPKVPRDKKGRFKKAKLTNKKTSNQRLGEEQWNE